ncbi:hypothetical protein [Salinispora arenicola]|uniref:hypothetical protein n=1 Tax=Salinispora arenicola TaxID=168697 RepID=UPI0027DD8E91|nr:hypothetical protein [Salinispora arenicola]
MQAFLDYSTKEFAAASTADERVDAVRDLLEGWYDRWDAHYPGAVTDEHDGIARHLVALITTAEAHASEDTAGTPIRYCVYPGCPRTYRADVGPPDRGWMRLRGLTVLCPDHSTAAAGRTQDTTLPAESHTQSPGDPGAGDPIGGTLPTSHSDAQTITGHDSDAWETVSGWIWSCRTCLDRGLADSEADARRQLSDHNTGSLPWWRTTLNTVGLGAADREG